MNMNLLRALIFPIMLIIIILLAAWAGLTRMIMVTIEGSIFWFTGEWPGESS